MSDVKKYLAKYVPQGTLIYSVPSTNTETSLLMNMMDQVEDFASKVQELQNLYNFKNYHLICHSQGGLICRSFIQLYPNHGVKVFISLSGVQNGQFGIPGILSWEQEWKKNFPFLWNLTKEEAFHFFYTDFFQKTMSVAGYWKDPFHYDEYRQNSQFLAVVNNDSLIHDYASKYQFRSNFLQIDKMVLTTSPDDEVIKPYYSALFGFYALNNQNQLAQSLMPDQQIYKNDVFGLKTLDSQKRLIVHVVPGINHMLWIESEQLVVQYMLPYLY
ncbi:predicted protein [Naegleria gruberi]|uniref:palmitoyl-CoA hydrolase n=1 Tax=Naegleria gruberi TaxID=5762 RepID=D2VVS0_NAEGR|nr:uncharacterized protein NAEGRDRAFT_73120 [Naegleria gruberi]EFC39157.1 predicted protein [Naegleria gruberi]|eukprot:XP_002671901.1 predicted protein [Naegleria gruberi strain NEG-M]